jgi:hypothetical protein
VENGIAFAEAEKTVRNIKFANKVIALHVPSGAVIRAQLCVFRKCKGSSLYYK